MRLAGGDHREAVFPLVHADIDDGDLIGLQHFLNHVVQFVGRVGAQANAAVGFGQFDEVGEESV